MEIVVINLFRNKKGCDSERGFEYGKINASILLYLLMKTGRHNTNRSTNTIIYYDETTTCSLQEYETKVFMSEEGCNFVNQFSTDGLQSSVRPAELNSHATKKNLPLKIRASSKFAKLCRIKFQVESFETFFQWKIVQNIKNADFGIIVPVGPLRRVTVKNPSPSMFFFHSRERQVLMRLFRNLCRFQGLLHHDEFDYVFHIINISSF